MKWIRRHAFAVVGLCGFVCGAATLANLSISRTGIAIAAVLLVVFVVWQYYEHRKPLIAVWHCICPHCGFAWAAAPEDLPDRCPRCGRAEAAGAAGNPRTS